MKHRGQWRIWIDIWRKAVLLCASSLPFEVPAEAVLFNNRESQCICLDLRYNSNFTFDDKQVCTFIFNSPNTSRTSGKRAGVNQSSARRKSMLQLRIGTVNVGSLSRRSGEVAEMVSRRCLDFCCLQETRWKGGGARTIGSEGARYKLFWVG